MKYINTEDINYDDKEVYNDYYKTFTAKFVHDSKLPTYNRRNFDKKAPLVTKTEAAKKKIRYDSGKIYGFYQVCQGFVPLYLPEAD